VTDFPSDASASVQSAYLSAQEALEANLHLLDRAARRYPMTRPDRQDAFQEAAVAFLLHYLDFDPSLGVPLKAFMWPWVLGAVRHFVRKLAVDGGRCTYVGDLTGVDRPVFDAAYGRVVDLDVERFLHALPPPDRSLITRLYWQDETLADIARSLGVTRQTLHARVRRLLASARTTIGPSNVTA
jgi:RNA polymerase sigma factor (sigma-70 family)